MSKRRDGTGARLVQPGDFPTPTAEELRRLEVEAQQKAIEDAGMKKARLELKLKEETKKLVPKCSECGGTDIRIKTSTHQVSSGNDIFGSAGRGPRFSTHVEFLYCESCGTTYYKSGVAKLERLMLEIEDAYDELSSIRNPRMC